MAERSVTVTRTQLAAALKAWDEEAASKGWNQRQDADRFTDSADYLLDKIEAEA